MRETCIRTGTMHVMMIVMMTVEVRMTSQEAI